MTTTKLSVGQKVTGEYHNVPFVGTIRDTEGHTLDYSATRLYIDLAQPIEVYGVVRNSVHILSDGTRGHSYVEAA